MNRLIEIYTHTAEGYNPFLIRDKWQVAQLNYVSGQGFADMDKVEVHRQTDEVFILLKGTAVLITAEKDGDKIDFQTVAMIKGITYNIPAGVWHNIAMAPDAQIIIVEDACTHLHDVTYFHLSDEQKKDIDTQLQSVT
jgi:mannose-6-phosphate isomerase-like protein (cupin superfamily)